MGAETHPTSFTLRAPTNDDLPGVFDLVTASDIREFGEPDYSLEEFSSDWRDIDHANDAQIAVEPGGRIVGYATSRGEGNYTSIDAEAYVHPKREGDGIGTALVRWTEERAARFVSLAPEGARVSIQNPTNAYNTEATSLLTGLGYGLARHFWRMQIILAKAPTLAPAPDGIVIRHVQDDADERRLWAATEEAFAEHWGHRPQSFEAWSGHRKRHGYDPRLWWMALDGDEIAGTLVGYVLPETGGWIQNVAVRAPWRRRGIAVALLERSFASFFECGVKSIALGVDAQNPMGATRLYERVGMSNIRGFAVFEKELRGGFTIADNEAG